MQLNLKHTHTHTQKKPHKQHQRQNPNNNNKHTKTNKQTKKSTNIPSTNTLIRREIPAARSRASTHPSPYTTFGLMRAWKNFLSSGLRISCRLAMYADRRNGSHLNRDTERNAVVASHLNIVQKTF